jgi:hypothetical protein
MPTKENLTVKKLDDLSKILLGNGDPEHGIVLRMVRIEDCGVELKHDLTEVKEDLTGVKNSLGRMEHHFKVKGGNYNGKGDKPKRGLVIPYTILDQVFNWLFRIAIFFILGEKVFKSVAKLE